MRFGTPYFCWLCDQPTEKYYVCHNCCIERGYNPSHGGPPADWLYARSLGGRQTLDIVKPPEFIEKFIGDFIDIGL